MRPRTTVALLASVIGLGAGPQLGCRSDAPRAGDGDGAAESRCITVSEGSGTTYQHCEALAAMDATYLEPLDAPIAVDDAWTTQAERLLAAERALIPAPAGDVAVRAAGGELRATLDGVEVRVVLLASGLRLEAPDESYHVEVAPALADDQRRRFLAGLVIEAISDRGLRGAPYVPWLALGRSDDVPKKKSIFKRVWDKVPRPIKRVTGRVTWVMAAAGFALQHWQTEEGCLAEMPNLCKNTAAQKCAEQLQPGQIFLGIEWPQIDQDGDGQPENYYGTCSRHFIPEYDAFGYRPDCAEAKCLFKCANAGAVGNCDNPCPSENAGLCCEDAGEMLCDEQIGCQLVQVDCDSSETSDCGADSACYES